MEILPPVEPKEMLKYTTRNLMYPDPKEVEGAKAPFPKNHLWTELFLVAVILGVMLLIAGI